MNNFVGSGYLCADPEMKNSKKTGKVFCKLRWCIQGDYRGQHTEREADFIDVLAFGDRGQTMNRNLRKGMRVLIRGSLKTLTRIDPYGQKRRDIYIIAKEYEMIDSHHTREPIEDLSDSSGSLLIPKEITDSLIKQVNAADEDMPLEYSERRFDDLL